ncbi:MAG: secondary thiamine-phosphate synthase enzyme YjbQ [Candidatus Helarchaeota archaeon]
MVTITDTISIHSKKELDMINITDELESIVSRSKLNAGICHVFVAGATGALIAIEYEPGLKKDFPDLLERISPKDLYYAHHETWHDDNGRSHVRASLIGPDITLPIRNGRLVHGTWQQIAFLELDTRGRSRELIVTLTGD